MSNKDQLKKIFVENWTSVYNTILGKDVILNIESVDIKNKAELGETINQYQSFVSMTYSSVPGEGIVILLKNKLVSIISNMMIGLDSFKDEITADDKDAFVEAVNQMFSACQVPIKEILGLEMRFKDVAFTESIEINKIITSDMVQVWNATIELPGITTEKYLLLLPEKFGLVEVMEEKIEELTIDTGIEKSIVSTGRDFSAYEGTNIDLILDVELPITIRIGSTEMKLIEIMRLGLGSIIELEKMVDDPVEILANEKLVARGEVVVCDGNYAVKIIEVQSKEERIKSLS